VFAWCSLICSKSILFRDSFTVPKIIPTTSTKYLIRKKLARIWSSGLNIPEKDTIKVKQAKEGYDLSQIDRRKISIKTGDGNSQDKMDK